MIRCNIVRETQEGLERALRKRFPQSSHVVKRVEEIYHSMPVWHQLALAWIGAEFNRPECRILEIGTNRGGSAAIWAEVAPQSEIITLEPIEERFLEAKFHLQRYRNVKVVNAFSWDYIETYYGPEFDLIFVDGNHILVHRDLVWWNWLKVPGLMLFHDYSPATYPVVCAAVNDMAGSFGRPRPGLVIRRVGKSGIAGIWRKKTEEVWPEINFKEVGS